MLLEVAESLQTVTLVLADPALVDFVNGDGVEEVELFPTVPDGGDEVGVLKEIEVLGHGLAGHVEVLAEGGEGLAVVLMQQVQQLAAAGIGQGFENGIHDMGKIGNHMVACQRRFGKMEKSFDGCLKSVRPFVERMKHSFQQWGRDAASDQS